MGATYYVELKQQTILTNPELFPGKEDQRKLPVEVALQEFLKSHSWIYIEMLEKFLNTQGYTLGDTPLEQMSVDPESEFQNRFLRHASAFPQSKDLDSSERINIIFGDRYTGVGKTDTYYQMAVAEYIKSNARPIIEFVSGKKFAG